MMTAVWCNMLYVYELRHNADFNIIDILWQLTTTYCRCSSGYFLNKIDSSFSPCSNGCSCQKQEIRDPILVNYACRFSLLFKLILKFPDSKTEK